VNEKSAVASLAALIEDMRLDDPAWTDEQLLDFMVASRARRRSAPTSA